MHDEFTAVYRAHVRFVWRLCRALGVAPAHVDDVVHDVFLVVRRRLPDRDTRWPLAAWLGRIARNTVMHHRRGLARAAERESMAPVPTAVRGPDEALDLSEAAALLQSFLDGLEPARREVFALIDIEGLSAPEVTEICDAKLPTVYTRLRAARLAFTAFVAALPEPRRVEGAP
jgi:RNA polymerase sigma-70 factor (ECF subfamily)